MKYNKITFVIVNNLWSVLYGDILYIMWFPNKASLWIDIPTYLAT